MVYYQKRPDLSYYIPDCYKNLIKECWAVDPKMRPTFDEIVFELENSDEFITEFIDKDEYLYYIDFVNSNNKEHNSKLESTSPIKNTENHTEQSIKEKHIINANNHFHKRIEEKEKVDEFEIDLDQTNNSNSRNKNNDAVLKSNQKINENNE